MASPASLATLGSTRPSPSTVFVVCPPSAFRRRIHVISSIDFGSYSRPRQWPRLPARRFCKCMVTTNLIEEAGVQSSAVPVFKGSSGKEDDNVLLQPAPKPVPMARPNGPVGPVRSTLMSPERVAGGRRREATVDEREKVIESLGEVLEKAEKLETRKSVILRDEGAIRGAEKPNGGSTKPSAPVNTNSPTRKPKTLTKTLKSVWRKGSPVASVQRVVKELPKVEKEGEGEQDAPPDVAVSGNLEAPAAAPAPAPLRPPISPAKAPPRLQARPSVAPPSPPGVTRPTAPKERKGPILIDKFSTKKSVNDIAAEAVLAPTKPAKGASQSKLKDERRKRSSGVGSPRRRLAGNVDIPDDDVSGLGVAIAGVRKGRKWNKASRKAARLQAAKDAEPVQVEILEVGEEGMSAEDLAFNLAVSEAEIFSYLFSKGVRPDEVQTLDKDMVKMICKEYDVEVLEADIARVEEMAKKKEVLDEEDLDKLEPRPPVITIMGHVDHGKTTLLDYIRKSRVVASEAGGITQGIGAYQVLVPVDGKSQPCVFLDTPGHEAFGAMRARGARVTDLVIIVVAADDGVRPQTNEAIAHAKAAGVPMIVAINKIDKDGSNPDRVMQELSSVGLMPEIWGGNVPMIQISALKGENVDELLETVMLLAEMQELKANPRRNAKGTVIEAGLDKSKGPIATLIVQNGTLRKGDVVVCGEAFGKMRALFDDKGGRVDEAGPSMAVQVIGLSNVPIAGDEFEVVDSLDAARERADTSADSLRAARISAKTGQGKVTLSSIASSVSAGKQSGLDRHQLNIILKVDVQGSIEAIRHAVQVLPQDNVILKFLLEAPGDVSASDVDLAVAAEAIIFGFNVKASGSIKSYADKKNVEIRQYRVIYELLDDMRNAMEGLLDLVEEQVPIGAADVRATFSSGSGRVAGCMITEGKVVKGSGVRIVRKGKTIHTGIIDSLRRVKEEVKEVGAGLECGIGVDDFSDWEAGDFIQAFNSVQKKRTLEEASASVTAALVGAGVEV